MFDEAVGIWPWVVESKIPPQYWQFLKRNCQSQWIHSHPTYWFCDCCIGGTILCWTATICVPYSFLLFFRLPFYIFYILSSLSYYLFIFSASHLFILSSLYLLFVLVKYSILFSFLSYFGPRPKQLADYRAQNTPVHVVLSRLLLSHSIGLIGSNAHIFLWAHRWRGTKAHLTICLR